MRVSREKSSWQPTELFTASDVARFCQVDLKTIHNWADKGEIPHFRTPGRHLRFRRLDVLEFLRKFGYSVPDVLRQTKPRIVVVDVDQNSLAQWKQALSHRFEVHSFSDPIDALVTIASLEPECIVLDLQIPNFDAFHFIERLRSLPSTKHIRAVVYAQNNELDAKLQEHGVVRLSKKEDTTELTAMLDKMMGFDREYRG